MPICRKCAKSDNDCTCDVDELYHTNKLPIQAYIFDGEVNIENIDALVDWINQQAGYELHIYLKSEGGDPDCATIIVDFLTSISKEKRVLLIGTGYISSAAFDIFLFSKCRKRVTEHTYAIIHKTVIPADNPDGKDKEYTERKRIGKIQDENLLSVLKSVKLLTAQEIKDFNNGRDVVLDYARLCRLVEK